MTIVPNGVVLFVLEKLKSWISTQPSGGLLVWSDFLVRSRDWIHLLGLHQSSRRQGTPARTSSISPAAAITYNNVAFHRVIEFFMLKGGAPTESGHGGPG